MCAKILWMTPGFVHWFNLERDKEHEVNFAHVRAWSKCFDQTTVTDASLLDPELSPVMTQLESLCAIAHIDHCHISWEQCKQLIILLRLVDQVCEPMSMLDPKTLARGQNRLFILSREALVRSKGTTLLRNFPESEGCVLPKCLKSDSSTTLRALSENLCYLQASTAIARWIIPNYLIPSSFTFVDSGGASDSDQYDVERIAETPDAAEQADACKNVTNILIIAYPWKISDACFRKVGYGRFDFDPPQVGENIDPISTVLSKDNAIEIVIFPELALQQDDYERIKQLLQRKVEESKKAMLLVSGISACRVNGLKFSIIAPGGGISEDFFQNKHHPWRLDGHQFRQYGLENVFSSENELLESCEINPKDIYFVRFRADLCVCFMICEDIRQPEPIAEIIRHVAPNLIVALLLDGPQIPARWCGTAAKRLSEGCGATVLTVTSSGMVKRSKPLNGGPKATECFQIAGDLTAQPPKQKKANRSRSISGIFKIQISFKSGVRSGS